MGTNDDFYAKELNLNYFYMHSNSEQKYPKMAIVFYEIYQQFLDKKSRCFRYKAPNFRQNYAELMHFYYSFT